MNENAKSDAETDNVNEFFVGIQRGELLELNTDIPKASVYSVVNGFKI